MLVHHAHILSYACAVAKYIIAIDENTEDGGYVALSELESSTIRRRPMQESICYKRVSVSGTWI